MRLKDGTYQPVTVLGLDDTSLFGRPELIEGNIADIYAENGFVVVKDEEYAKLENPKMGTEFELNDNRGVIVGIAKVPASGLFGIPTLYTTFNRAIQYIPSMRYTISFILVEPQSAAAIPHIQEEVARLGYDTVTEQGFIDQITNWYMFHTGMGTNLLLMTAISFIVGLSISGQTFYTFVLENLDKFGALKAIGAKGRELVAMIFFQAALTGLAGYGLGIGLCAGLIALAKLRVPDYASIVTYGNLGARARDGARDLRVLRLHRGPQGPADRPLRHLPRLTMSTVAIRAEGLTKWFGQGEAKTCAVRDVTFEARFHEMLYIVGPSGSGKTTLLSIISGILRPDAGTVRVEDTDVWAPQGERARRLPPQQDRLRLPGLPPLPEPHDGRERRHPARAQAARLERGDRARRRSTSRSSGLAARAQLNPTRLSGGEQQRVAIARALASGPDLMIFDEPTASLDGDTGKKIVEFVKQRRPDRASLHRRRHARRSHLRVRGSHPAHGGRAAARRKRRRRCVTRSSSSWSSLGVLGALVQRLRLRRAEQAAAAGLQPGAQPLRAGHLRQRDHRELPVERREHQHLPRGRRVRSCASSSPRGSR